VIEAGLLQVGQSVTLNGEALAYLIKGAGSANGEAVAEGDLIRSDGLAFEADEETQLITVTLRA
jgi:hypothetical protein